jgi:ketosteroid isomerase-like protein
MAQENVEIVRALAESFQRRDHERAFEFYDPEIEWNASRCAAVIPDLAGVYRGHEGVRTYWRRFLSAWNDLEFEVDAVRQAGDDVVLLIRNQRQWGRHTGIATEFPSLAMVFTFSGGKVVRVCTYTDWHAALEAVGLRE